MSKRGEHSFQFRAGAIADAAGSEAEYHEGRAAWWAAVQDAAADEAMAAASIVLKEYAVTGGRRLELVVHYGDPTVVRRMEEAYTKAQDHRAKAERFRTDEELYRSQVRGSEGSDRAYELDADDVHHFRLNGRAREE